MPAASDHVERQQAQQHTGHIGFLAHASPNLLNHFCACWALQADMTPTVTMVSVIGGGTGHAEAALAAATFGRHIILPDSRLHSSKSIF